VTGSRAGDGGPEGPGGPATAPRLVLPAALARRLAREAEAAYPREGCGVLLGETREGRRVVSRIEPAPNRWSDRADRYLVDPGTIRRLQDEEAEGGDRILGFYHSHPDAEPVPSETDRAHAWPWYLYYIVPVREGSAGAGRAWELERGTEGGGDDGARAEFRERAVLILGPGPGTRGAPRR